MSSSAIAAAFKLLRSGELRNERGFTPLMAAGISGKVDLVRGILLSCADDEERETLLTELCHGEEGMTALLASCCSGQFECAEALLEHIPEKQLQATDSSGKDALMLAAQCGFDEAVSVLLRHIPEEQVFRRDSEGRTALMGAAACSYRHHANAVDALIGGQRMVAVHHGVVLTEEELKTAAIAKFHELQESAVDCVRMLLSYSPEDQVRARDEHGMSALMHAASSSHAACMETLLRHACEEQVQAADDQGWTALMYAADNLDADMDGNADGDGQVQMDVACVKILLSRGASLPADAELLAKLRPIIKDGFQELRVPEMLHQAIAHSLASAALPPSGHKRPRS